VPAFFLLLYPRSTRSAEKSLFSVLAIDCPFAGAVFMATTRIILAIAHLLTPKQIAKENREYRPEKIIDLENKKINSYF